MMDKVLYGAAVIALLCVWFLWYPSSGVPGPSTASMWSLGAAISLAITGYLVGLIEDIRDAVSEDQ
jgi:hypothetical protein